ncbi:MAG: RluA family pseudouridine synthase [Phascolarctobacterium sp.]|nr:RluA family pseudouridine synthase [Phascolarctobacterium sp.]
MEHYKDGTCGQQECIIITEREAGQRADIVLASFLELSRSNVQKLLDEGLVIKDNKVLKANYRVKTGDAITVSIPELRALDVRAENIPLDVIYEDEDIIIINKARGMVVHPAAGNYSGTLVNALLYHCKNLSGINGVIRPGIVHRLDKDTSGIIICAKNDNAHLALSEQIQNKTAMRTYLAVVRGNIKNDSGIIETQIARDREDRKKMAVVTEGGRDAVTEYEVLERFGRYTIVTCRLRTGRTHQIRVHMEYIGHPLVGDPKYSPMKTPFTIDGQALHSQKLSFVHPKTMEHMKFEAPLPVDMQKIFTRLRLGQFT